MSSTSMSSMSTSSMSMALLPQSGWQWHSMVDHGRPADVCEACGYDGLRYVHSLRHPKYSGTLEVGVCCADRLTSRLQASECERAHKNWLRRRQNWLAREWRVSNSGNYFLNVDGSNVVVFESSGGWRWRIEDRTTEHVRWAGKPYPFAIDAKLAAFEALCPASASIITPW